MVQSIACVSHNRIEKISLILVLADRPLPNALEKCPFTIQNRRTQLNSWIQTEERGV